MIANIIYLLILLTTTIFGTVSYKKLAVSFKLLTLLFALTFLSEVANRICARVFRNSIPVYHIQALIEFILFSLINYHLFKKKGIKKIIFISLFIIPVFIIINAFVIQSYRHVFPSNVLMISEIIYVVLSILLYKQMLLTPLQVSLFKQSIFWYATSLLVFSAISFILFGIYNYLIERHHNIPILEFFNYFINYLFYIGLAYSIYLNSKETKPIHE